MLSLVTSPAAAQTCDSSIASNFNGTSIAAGRFVWFNAVTKISGRDPGAETIVRFDASRLEFSSGGTTYSLDVPAARIEFSPATVLAETGFDDYAGVWVTRLPASYTGNAFLSGLAFQVPAPGLPGGTNPVIWSGRFTSNVPGLKASWQWAAAAYSTFSSAAGDLQVKPVDNKISVYQNSDHAGTPEKFRASVIGGARGGGGSNFTGSYSGTASLRPCVASRELTLSKSFLSEEQIVPGGGEFLIEVTNHGPTAAAGVTVSDALDPLFTGVFVTLDRESASCQLSGQTLSCSLGGLSVGETAVVRVSYRLDAVPLDVGFIVNCATASDSDGNSARGCATLKYLGPT